MAEENTQQKFDISAYALESAKKIGFGTDEAKYKQWEADFIRKFYEVIGLSDIPEQFLNWNKFLDAYSGVLVKSVQSDLSIMNLTKRLAMFRLSENIQSTEDKPEAPAEDAKPAFVPPTQA